MAAHDPADVCVIGAGPAGAILAASLAERGHDVVVLEAGPRFDLDERLERLERGLRGEHGSADVWDMGGPRDAYTWSGDFEYNLNAHRIKGVGGTSLHWGGVTPRLHPEDFRMASTYGLADDWPITYEEVAPYYRQAERTMGVSGARYQFSGPRAEGYPLPPFPPSYSDQLLEDACAELGIELHPVPRAMNSEPYDGRNECVGYGTCQIVCPSGGKYDASVHARRAERDGARVRTRAPVDRLVLDDSGERVTEAVYAGPDGDERRQRARHFVVACGAVESARLLLQSATDGHPNGLANSSGAVGRNLMIHPGIKTVGKLDQPTRQHLIGFSTRMTEQFYDHDQGPEGTMILTLSNTAGTAPATAATRQTSHAKHLLDGNVDALIGGRLADEVDEETGLVGITAWVEQLPDPDNRVSLDESKTDDRGNPVPEVTWRLDDHSRATLRSAARICRAILQEAGVTDISTIGTPDHPLLLSHRMGTVRMGTDPDHSVVTPQLRTHDVSNLSVSSSGAFVTAGAANPTLTIVALTLRLADHLHERLG